MSAGTLAVESVAEGDTWRGVPDLTVKIGGVAPTTTLTGVVMEFMDDGVILDTLTTGNGRITVLDSATWQIRIEETPLKLKRGLWHFGVKYFDSEGHAYTLLEGRLKVTKEKVKSTP